MADIAVSEYSPMKFKMLITIRTVEEEALIPVIETTVDEIKAAGVYPFYQYTFDIVYHWFILETSIIDGDDILW
jgi:hypothetical protein